MIFRFISAIAIARTIDQSIQKKGTKQTIGGFITSLFSFMGLVLLVLLLIYLFQDQIMEQIVLLWEVIKERWPF